MWVSSPRPATKTLPKERGPRGTSVLPLQVPRAVCPDPLAGLVEVVLTEGWRELGMGPGPEYFKKFTQYISFLGPL